MYKMSQAFKKTQMMPNKKKSRQIFSLGRPVCCLPSQGPLYVVQTLQGKFLQIHPEKPLVKLVLRSLSYLIRDLGAHRHPLR